MSAGQAANQSFSHTDNNKISSLRNAETCQNVSFCWSTFFFPESSASEGGVCPVVMEMTSSHDPEWELMWTLGSGDLKSSLLGCLLNVN